MAHGESNGELGKRGVPDVPLDEPLDSVLNSQTEAFEIRDENLKQDEKRRSHHRREGIKSHAHLAGLAILWLVVGVLMSMIFVWGYHLVTSDCIHFLSPQQFDELENIVTSAAVAALASEYMRRLL